MEGTGGGPASLEQEVIDLVNLNHAVEGLKNVRQFGMPSSTTKATQSAAAAKTHETEGQPKETQEPSAENVSPYEDYEYEPRQNRSSQQPLSVIANQQLECQQKFHENISKNLQQITEKIEDVNTNIKKGYRELGSLRDTLKLDYEERKRHNRAMEELAAKKLKLKQQILELELSRNEIS